MEYKDKSKWQYKNNLMGMMTFCERTLTDEDGKTWYEMYGVIHNEKIDWYYASGATFRLDDYDAADWLHAIQEFEANAVWTNETKLAEALFVTHFTDHLLGMFKTSAEAHACINDWVCRDFEDLYNDYKAKGYRFIEFCRPCEGGWLMAFDLEGHELKDLPKSAFDIPEVLDWCELLKWSLYDPDVDMVDLTDDLGGILGSYDCDANYPVMHLSDKWHNSKGFDKEYEMKFTLDMLRSIRPGYTLSQYESIAKMLINNWNEGMGAEMDGIIDDLGFGRCE